MLKYCLKFLFQFLFRNKTTINAPKYRKVGIKKMMEPIQTEKRDQESSRPRKLNLISNEETLIVSLNMNKSISFLYELNAK
jgi:hypothetical protein